MQNWLKQNWKMAGIVTIILAGLFFSQSLGKTDDELDIISSKSSTDYSKWASAKGECLDKEMAYAVSSESRNAGAVVEVANEKEDGTPTLTVKTIAGEVIAHTSGTLPYGDPVFSLDDDELYYRKSYVTTTTAVYALNLETSKERFITGGREYALVPSGKYAGKLAVKKLKYFLEGGSYLWYWLVDPKTGKELEVNPISSLGLFFDVYVCTKDKLNI